MNPVGPFDLEAEAAVVSSILLAATSTGAEPGALAVARTIVRPEHMYSEAHRRIYEAAIDLAEAGENIDAVTMVSWLRDHERLAQVGGFAYVTQVLNAAPAVAHVASYARIVARLALRREMASRLERAAIELRTRPDAAGVIERMRPEVEAIFAMAGTAASPKVFEAKRT
jgi:replicative DNA helicase